MRRWGVALVLGALVFAATGCGGGSSSSSASSQPLSTDKTPVTLTLRHPWTGDENKLFEQAIGNFEKKYPWITVEDDRLSRFRHLRPADRDQDHQRR